MTLLNEKMYVALPLHPLLVCCCRCVGVSGGLAISFLTNVAQLSFSAERSLTSAGLRYTSSVLRCKHRNNRIYTLRKTIRRCLRFVYISIHSVSHHGCINIDLLLLCAVPLLAIQLNGMLSCELCLCTTVTLFFKKDKCSILAVQIQFPPKLCVEFNSIMLDVKN